MCQAACVTLSGGRGDTSGHGGSGEVGAEDDAEGDAEDDWELSQRPLLRTRNEVPVNPGSDLLSEG